MKSVKFETKQSTDFEHLCNLEPRLRELLADVKAIAKKKRGRFYCANEVWFTQFKPRLLMLVGWEVRNPELGTPESYDLAYDILYRQLPPCRRCICG